MVGDFNSNPLLNTIMYDVEFSDGATKEYAANTIAESLYSTVDSNGHSRAVLESILDHTKDDRAIEKADKYLVTKSGSRRIRKTTIG